MSVDEALSENGEGLRRLQVGRAMESNPIMNLNHPIYKTVAQLVSEESSKRAAQEMERNRHVSPMVLTVVAGIDTVVALEKLYPEFRVINMGYDKVGHEFYQSCNAMANALMLRTVGQLASTVVHVGGSLLASMVTDLDIHIERDYSLSYTAHDVMRDQRNCAKIMGDYADFSGMTGITTARQKYDEYLFGKKGRTCARVDCKVKADALCADLSKYFMDLSQAACAIYQASAHVGEFFMPYHESMLLLDEGEIPGTGVYYEKRYDLGVLRFKYPEGVCGVEAVPLAGWASWLGEHEVVFGRGAAQRTYHLQLRSVRGPFLSMQLVQSIGPLSGTRKFSHALQLGFQEPTYLISGWKLAGLASDPTKASSWLPVRFTAPRAVVDRVYAYGLQLDQKSFSRYALRQRLRTMDRITVNGTQIAKGYDPTDVELDLLVTQLHAEIFVQRYESGTLSRELLDLLASVKGFGAASTWEKVKSVATWTVVQAWDSTVGLVANALERMCDWLHAVFSQDKRRPTFELAPERVLLETVHNTWTRLRGHRYNPALRAVSRFANPKNLSLRGGSLAQQIGLLLKEAPAGRSDLEEAAAIHVGKTWVDSTEQRKVDVSVTPEQMSALQEALMTDMRVINDMDAAPSTRHVMPTELLEREPDPEGHLRSDYHEDPDFVGTLNEAHSSLFPAVDNAPLHVDVFSIQHDPQHRFLEADKMRIPRLHQALARPKDYYVSRLNAVGAPKRQETGPELLSAMSSRNLAAPVVALPQDNAVVIEEVWEKFLDNMCVKDARVKLESYAADPVGLEEGAFLDWQAQANPQAVSRVAQDVEEVAAPLLLMDVGRYFAMMKADVKPPMSDKPERERIEPQVIVYHSKALSAMYSSIFRVLVRRFQSLLKPNVHVNLLKDLSDVKQFLQAAHKFEPGARYLENDFSKYDKSQSEFAFELERKVFSALGMNQRFLERWVEGHQRCRVDSFVTGIVLWVWYQRKSGDATTAFGNVILNVLSTSYAYGLSDFDWALFMGDDSLVCVRGVAVNNNAVQVLAEVFNLQAKMYMTDSPYYASTFFIFDSDTRRVIALPDPVKRIEKWSQMVSADNPNWEDRYRSATENCAAYSSQANVKFLPRMLVDRYGMAHEHASRVASAVATAISSFDKFRSMWEEDTREISA